MTNSATCSHGDHQQCAGYVIQFARGHYGENAYRYEDEDCGCKCHKEK